MERIGNQWFLNGTPISGLALSGKTFADNSGIGANSILNINGIKAGSASVLLQSIVANGVGTVPILSSSDNGDIVYQYFSGLGGDITTTLSPGGGGTLKIDVLNKTSKIVTGRFDVITIGNILGGTFHVVGSFRAHYN